jgi:hypothetical protein
MPKRKAKPDPRYAEQPAVAAILKLVHRPRGVTVAEIAKARGLQPHTVRSVLSRIGSKAGLALTRTKVEGRGGIVYSVARYSAPCTKRFSNMQRVSVRASTTHPISIRRTSL